ncbi:MAG: GNAT family N-acetyltransferase [Chloroflexota bacterium]|nr:GNAT family N-acetyltransferase [Chloroflexota bacterium]
MNIRPLTLHDRHAWSALLAVCFERSPEQTGQIIDWLQKMDTVIAWGAWDDDQLAAQYACLMRTVWLPDGGAARVGMSLNMAVHPDYRGQGLIKRVAAPVYNTVRDCGGVAGIGFSNAEGVQVDKHSKSYGYQVIGRMQSLLALVPPRRNTTQLVLSEQFPPLDLMSSDVHTSPCYHFATSYATLYDRFAAHPFRQYHYGIWQEAGVLRGVVVFRPAGSRVLHGVSLLAALGDDLDDLLCHWLSALGDAGYRYVHVLASPHASIRHALATITTLLPLPYSRSPFYLTTKPLCDDLPASWLDFAAWDCIGGEIL